MYKFNLYLLSIVISLDFIKYNSINLSSISLKKYLDSQMEFEETLHTFVIHKKIMFL